MNKNTFIKPYHFDECFTENIRKTNNFSVYFSLIKNLSSKTPTDGMPEKHHIVPREWLTFRFKDFNFDNEDKNNVIYLSVKTKLLCLLYLTYIFLDKKDSITYQSITKTIARRYHIKWFDFWRNPYLDKTTITNLVEQRQKDILTKKKKYETDYLEKCLSLYNSEPDKEKAFEKIKNEYGFKFSKRAFLEQIKKRFSNKNEIINLH